jgi:hypothetical protein
MRAATFDAGVRSGQPADCRRAHGDEAAVAIANLKSVSIMKNGPSLNCAAQRLAL